MGWFSINCVSFKDGLCLHQAAPRKFLRYTSCILLKNPSNDVRILDGCRLQVEYKKPVLPPPCPE